uniref:ABC transmembrane type-1 domain-containing protein n=1 Tax=Ditylenchus dipsaci TaxID=166011 RepID=A0A915CVV9_9BILA
MEICTSWSFFPPNICSYIACSCATLLVLSLLNLFFHIRHRFWPSTEAHQPLRPGSLTFFFYLACVCHVLAGCVPVVYWLTRLLFYSRTEGIAAVAVHSIFWASCLHALIVSRHGYEAPLRLVFSYSIAAGLLLVPLVSWATFFPLGFSETYALYYIFEAFFVYSLFLIVLSRASLKKDYYSPWENALSKCIAIWPYVWPKKSIRLQLHVYMCIFMLVIGRVINVVVPLYSKWIVDALSGPHPFCYDLILVASILKFLQGNGAAGGFLNTLRSFLWIQIQQYTTLEIEVDMVQYLHQLSLKWHMSRKTGEVIRIMDRGTTSINALLSYILFNVFPTIVDIILAAAFFFFKFNAYFGFLVMVTMSIYLG